MVGAMFIRQSRLLYSLFHKVDTKSKRHGGELVAQVFKSHGVDNIFTLPGGHVSPISVASEKLKIKVIDVRHEATAVFAADASARLSGIPGVAVVTAGPGLTNTVTAIKNAQMAESPIVVIAGAAATMLKNRGSLQDVDQISIVKSAAKKCFTVDCVRDITPTLREAFRVCQVDVPGPVFVELPVDILYPYQIIAEQFAAIAPSKEQSIPVDSKTSSTPVKKKGPSLKQRIIQAYSSYSLNHIFAEAFREQDYDPLPISVKQPNTQHVKQVADMLRKAKRPLLLVGSQSTLRPYGPDSLVENLQALGVPMYLSGSARGLMGANFPLQFRHARKNAVQESDCVILLGAVCDFRLSYGRIFKKSTKVVCVNRSLDQAKLNAGIFWNPELTIESDVGKFVEDLTCHLAQTAGSDSATSEKVQIKLENLDKTWIDQLVKRDRDKDDSIKAMSEQPTDKHLNPLQLLLELRKVFEQDDCILVADGGDFVASAAYIMKPNGPLRWLDPGPFGTLGCGAGFALAAKLLNPDKKVIAIMGDGAFGYAIPELDTLVRHKLPVFTIIGNDACWTQIVREQEPMLGSRISCELAYTDYHRIADGFGATGYLMGSEKTSEDICKRIEAAKKTHEHDNQTVVVNALIGKTKFRDGSISI